MFLQNVKSVALPVPEIIGGTQKIWAARGYAHAPFCLKFLWAFIRIGPVNVLTKFDVRSFTRSRDNRGTQKIWMASGYAHAPFSPKFSTGFYSEWPCKYIPPNLKSVALPVPKIRGVAKLQTPNLEGYRAKGVGDGTLRKSVGQFLLALHTYYSSISTRLSEILDCSFQWGYEPPILGKGRP